MVFLTLEDCVDDDDGLWMWWFVFVFVIFLMVGGLLDLNIGGTDDNLIFIFYQTDIRKLSQRTVNLLLIPGNHHPFLQREFDSQIEKILGSTLC